jgi:hypothetical protein
VISACTDKDREMAKRQSDGTETFKFKAPDLPSGAPTKSEGSNPPKKPKLDVKNDGDGTETFEFKRDARYFPPPKREAGK